MDGWICPLGLGTESQTGIEGVNWERAQLYVPALAGVPGTFSFSVPLGGCQATNVSEPRVWDAKINRKRA